MNSLKILLIEDDTIEVMKLNRVVASMETKHKIIEANKQYRMIKIKLEDMEV